MRAPHLAGQADDGELEAEVRRQEAVVQRAAERRLELLRLGDELVRLDGEALRGTASGLTSRRVGNSGSGSSVTRRRKRDDGLLCKHPRMLPEDQCCSCRCNAVWLCNR